MRPSSVARVALPLGGWYLILAGSLGGAELVAASIAGLLAALYAAGLGRRARVSFRPPWRWVRALARALPQLGSESALLAAALARQLSGGAPVEGADDAGRVAPRGVDAVTTAIAAAAYPCLTPNTVVRAVQHRGRVSGRRLLDRAGHRLEDDLARLS